MSTTSEQRAQALESSIRVALANGGHEKTDEIVTRATAFAGFVAGETDK